MARTSDRLVERMLGRQLTQPPGHRSRRQPARPPLGPQAYVGAVSHLSRLVRHESGSEAGEVMAIERARLAHHELDRRIGPRLVEGGRQHEHKAIEQLRSLDCGAEQHPGAEADAQTTTSVVRGGHRTELRLQGGVRPRRLRADRGSVPPEVEEDPGAGYAGTKRPRLVDRPREPVSKYGHGLA